MRFEVQNICVSVNGTRVVSDASLALEAGEMHALMGSNGSGKSSLLQSIAGNPRYVVEKGAILLNGVNITQEAPEKRARRGLFVAFQQPVEIPGVSLPSFLRSAVNAIAEERGEKAVSPAPFVEGLKRQAAAFGLSDMFLQRGINEGFSGGEKKKVEILQMLALKPRVVLLDEIDSGLDIDAIRAVASAVDAFRKENGAAVLWVTHNPRVLPLIGADRISVMAKGAIIDRGGAALAHSIEQEGFARYE